MASITHGMNVESVRGIAKQLDGQAHVVDQVIGAVDKLISQTQSDWVGKDSQQFQQLWHGQYKGQLQKLKQELSDLAVKARSSARSQEDASNQL